MTIRVLCSIELCIHCFIYNCTNICTLDKCQIYHFIFILRFVARYYFLFMRGSEKVFNLVFWCLFLFVRKVFHVLCTHEPNIYIKTTLWNSLLYSTWFSFHIFLRSHFKCCNRGTLKMLMSSLRNSQCISSFCQLKNQYWYYLSSEPIDVSSGNILVFSAVDSLLLRLIGLDLI